MKAHTLILTAALAITGCSSTPKMGTTLPGETEHQAIGTGYTEEEATQMAAYTAQQYCKDQDKRHAIRSTQDSYQGVINETSRDAIDTVADLAAYTGNWFPTPGSDKDHKATLVFICL